MKVTRFDIEGLLLIEPKVFEDSRGYFFESYNENSMKDIGVECQFVQDNQSYSKKGTLRGLHFQTGSSAQAKLVRVVSGEVLDVAVDLRKQSQTFGQWHSVVLSCKNKHQLFIPRGFAHGFITLSEEAIFQYKCDNFYDPNNESGIIFNDQTLGIDWTLQVHQIVVSEKDSKLKSFDQVRDAL